MWRTLHIFSRSILASVYIGQRSVTIGVCSQSAANQRLIDNFQRSRNWCAYLFHHMTRPYQLSRGQKERGHEFTIFQFSGFKLIFGVLLTPWKKTLPKVM